MILKDDQLLPLLLDHYIHNECVHVSYMLDVFIVTCEV